MRFSAPSTVAAVDPELIAKISIRRLYVHSVASDMEAVVVLEAWYTPRDGRTWQRRYRGRAQRVNWLSAADEYEDILNRALDDVINQIALDLRAACGAPARPSTVHDESRALKGSAA